MQVVVANSEVHATGRWGDASNPIRERRLARQHNLQTPSGELITFKPDFVRLFCKVPNSLCIYINSLFAYINSLFSSATVFRSCASSRQMMGSATSSLRSSCPSALAGETWHIGQATSSPLGHISKRNPAASQTGPHHLYRFYARLYTFYVRLYQRYDCIALEGVEAVRFIAPHAKTQGEYWAVVTEDHLPHHEKFLDATTDALLQVPWGNNEMPAPVTRKRKASSSI